MSGSGLGRRIVGASDLRRRDGHGSGGMHWTGHSLRQRTLREAVECTGIGLHSGQPVTLVLRPAPVEHGIRFRRTDLPEDEAEIPARYDHVCDTRMCTTLANRFGAKVATVEHLMAALAGLGIDNAVVELDGPEVPAMDGSAAPFVFLLECAGIVQQAAARRSLKVLKRVQIVDGERRCELLPHDGFAVEFEIEFDSPAVKHKQGRFELRPDSFKRELAAARTFGFERDVQQLWSMGLARGGSLDNAVVVSADHRILNENGLRYDDEFVRHKVLDAIGDLYLAGAPMQARLRCVRSGHAMNNRLLRQLFADRGAYAIVPAETVPAAWVGEPSLSVAG